MGRISQRLRWGVVAASCVLAVLLNIGLTTFGSQVMVTYCDYHTRIMRGPIGDPVIPLGVDIADTFCMGTKSTVDSPHAVMAFATTRGLFVRPRVPAFLALWGGAIIPAILLLCAAFMALRVQLSIKRALSITALAAMGTVMISFWGLAMITGPGIPLRYFLNYAWPLVLPAAFFGGAYWLWRARPGKERA